MEPYRKNPISNPAYYIDVSLDTQEPIIGTSTAYQNMDPWNETLQEESNNWHVDIVCLVVFYRSNIWILLIKIVLLGWHSSVSKPEDLISAGSRRPPEGSRRLQKAPEGPRRPQLTPTGL